MHLFKRLPPAVFSLVLAFGGASHSVAAADQKIVDAGEQLFDQNCAICHQADAIGKPGFAPSLTNEEFLTNASDRFIMATISGGRPGTAMIPFAHLGNEEVAAIVAYLRSHSGAPNLASKVDAQPAAKGDAASGKALFDQICSTCHGMNGNGYAAGGTGTAIGNRQFLAAASDGFLRVTIKQGRSNTRMRGFQGPQGLADLSDREIDDIIVYLRSLAK
jgi:cbb3-type cytochrome c oxidase subunit III